MTFTVQELEMMELFHEARTLFPEEDPQTLLKLLPIIKIYRDSEWMDKLLGKHAKDAV